MRDRLRIITPSVCRGYKQFSYERSGAHIEGVQGEFLTMLTSSRLIDSGIFLKRMIEDKMAKAIATNDSYCHERSSLSNEVSQIIYLYHFRKEYFPLSEGGG